MCIYLPMVESCCDMPKTPSDDSPESQPCVSSKTARRRRLEIRRFKFPSSLEENDEKKPKRLKVQATIFSCDVEEQPSVSVKCGVASLLGRRRDMEDAVAVHPSFHADGASSFHFFGLYDGHGCSHVSTRCKERMHELVKEEMERTSLASINWHEAMERSFSRMDEEAIAWNKIGKLGAKCRCELQPPKCNAVGSTAVVAVLSPDRLVVANCGDSRAVLSRNGKVIPLSLDHKPDRPDELSRIEEAGGRVIYWDGARVLGVLAMSRAIGDNYLKPYVTSVPEVTVTERDDGDEFLILASDGLWDVVSNETACDVARMCLKGKSPDAADVASVLLTKLAIARNSTDNISVAVVDLTRMA